MNAPAGGGRPRYAPKLILHAPDPRSPDLERFVEDCLEDGVRLISVVGAHCERVHNIIDELVVGDGSDPERGVDLLTSWHTGEPIESVYAFAGVIRIDGRRDLPVQEVVLGPPATASRP